MTKIVTSFAAQMPKEVEKVPYPCPYWGIAACYYHYGGNCMGSCSYKAEYEEWDRKHNIRRGNPLRKDNT